MTRIPKAHTIAVRFAGAGGQSVDVERRNRRKTAVQVQRETAEIMDKNPPTGGVTVTAAMLRVLHACAVDSTQRGKGGRFLSVEDDQARAGALREAPDLFKDSYARAKAAGVRNPRRRARERTAELLYARVIELGGNPPSIETIRKKWKY